MATRLLFLGSDAGILHQIRNGNEDALVRLYRENRRTVTAFVTRNNGTTDDAEDMLQEALVILWERVRAGKFEYTAKLGTFIFATVRNMWLRRLARARKERSDPDAGVNEISSDASPLEKMIEDEEARLVAQALEMLGEPCRQLLLLFYWEEQSLEEIALALGFANASTAKSKKYQCKKTLETTLNKLMS